MGRADGAGQRPAAFTPRLGTDTEAPSRHGLPRKATFDPEYERTMLPVGLGACRELQALTCWGSEADPNEGLPRSSTRPYVRVRMMCADGWQLEVIDFWEG